MGGESWEGGSKGKRNILRLFVVAGAAAGEVSSSSMLGREVGVNAAVEVCVNAEELRREVGRVLAGVVSEVVGVDSV